MSALLPYTRLVLAAFLGLALTACFDHGKKCDPKPTPTTNNAN